ncbi:hypothetical protein [Bacillus sp. Hm123]|uniref:hypothetical protein n=1 Tax=Bacillus sp. Hm123 TaxID=3450745 RepID=UPI003F443F6E
MATEKECLAAALTLLCKKGVLTVEEVKGASRQGYEGVFNLINQKYKEMVVKGEILVDR